MAADVPSIDEFLGLQLTGLESCDILTVNFHAARGLPGTEKSSLEAWLAKLDEWAARVKFEIRRHLYRFDGQENKPPTLYTYGNSLGRFFCWYMLQVLQEDCGIRYHPDRKFKPDFCKPRDVFAHGIMDDDGEGGTCASMPVVYVAVGRKLGLPVYPVETRGHGFFRWDDQKGTMINWENPNLVVWIPPDRFNVEGSGEGIAFYPDAHYIQWPELWKEIDFRHGRYLRSKTMREELAGFLMERGECWWDLGNWAEALKAFYYAGKILPEDERIKHHHAHRSRQYQEWRDRFVEAEQERRQRLPGLVGHSPQCPCAECQRTRKPVEQFRGHGPSCQCWNCRKEREAAKQPTGMPGHPPTCICCMCAMNRQMPTNPLVGAGNHRHHPSLPRLPGF